MTIAARSLVTFHEPYPQLMTSERHYYLKSAIVAIPPNSLEFKFIEPILIAVVEAEFVWHGSAGIERTTSLRWRAEPITIAISRDSIQSIVPYPYDTFKSWASL